MKKYDLYLFDWDGTLGRTLELWLNVIHDQFKRHGIIDITDSDVVESLGRLKPVAERLGMQPEQLESFLAAVQKDANTLALDVALYEGASELLDTLKNSGAKLALITTNWRESVDIMLSNHELESLFDIVISGDEVTMHKPDPEGIHTVLKTLKVPKSRAVMIGDSAHDLGAAQNAGIDSILFYPPSHQLFYDLKALKAYKPTYIIDGWDKLVVGD